MEKNKIYNQDCISYMKSLQIGKDGFEGFDLIIADPPYFSIFGEFDFIWKNVEEYLVWSKQWIVEAKRVLKLNGSFYMWGGIGKGTGYQFPKLAIWIDEEKIFHTVNWITQRNTRGYGCYKGYIQAREELIFCVNNESQYTWNPAFLDEKSSRKDLGANGKPRKNEFKRATDVWSDITEASQSSKERFKLSDGTAFPTVKAQALCERIIKASSNKGDLIYIPFAGSGSEIISCMSNQREWVATEISSIYIEEIINKRIKSLQSNNL